MLRIPAFQTIGACRWQGFSLTHGRLYPPPPRGDPWYSFMLEAESTPSPQGWKKDEVHKNSQSPHRKSNPWPSGSQRSGAVTSWKQPVSCRRLSVCNVAGRRNLRHCKMCQIQSKSVHDPTTHFLNKNVDDLSQFNTCFHCAFITARPVPLWKRNTQKCAHCGDAAQCSKQLRVSLRARIFVSCVGCLLCR